MQAPGASVAGACDFKCTLILLVDEATEACDSCTATISAIDFICVRAKRSERVWKARQGHHQASLSP